MRQENDPQRYIMLTDDDKDDCKMFSEVLEELYADARLTIINDGAKLMQALAETVPPPPEVIFMDLNMPKKNGFECLEEIRRTPEYKNIPVVIYSTSSNADIVDKTYDHGANYYIRKPSSYTLLKKTIAFVLSFDFHTLNRQPDRGNYIISIT